MMAVFNAVATLLVAVVAVVVVVVVKATVRCSTKPKEGRGARGGNVVGICGTHQWVMMSAATLSLLLVSLVVLVEMLVATAVGNGNCVEPVVIAVNFVEPFVPLPSIFQGKKRVENAKGRSKMRHLL